MIQALQMSAPVSQVLDLSVATEWPKGPKNVTILTTQPAHQAHATVQEQPMNVPASLIRYAAMM
jgi:hypothetical protein